MLKCPSCQSDAEKVIYAGFPMKICSNESCNTLWGFWSFIPGFWFNGVFFEYEESYIKGLIEWFKYEEDT